jgi:hypothetical protein
VTHSASDADVDDGPHEAVAPHFDGLVCSRARAFDTLWAQVRP